MSSSFLTCGKLFFGKESFFKDQISGERSQYHMTSGFNLLSMFNIAE